MFSSNVYFILCMALIGVILISAEEHEPHREPHHDNDDRKFKFPFSSINVQFHRNGEAKPNDGQMRHPGGRAPSSIVSPLVPCNYTEQGTLSCSSCNEVMVCLPTNLGVRHHCHHSYCVNGRCSETPSSACKSTSA